MECHTRKPSEDGSWECAGAAIYRANVIKFAGDRLKLPKDKARVFGWDNEFASHHAKRTVDAAEASRMKYSVIYGNETGEDK